MNRMFGRARIAVVLIAGAAAMSCSDQGTGAPQPDALAHDGPYLKKARAWAVEAYGVNAEPDEYHDLQQLVDDAGGYGPIAQTFANVNLGGTTTASAYEATTGLNVGFITIVTDDASKLPNTYKDAGLIAAVNCVYFRHVKGEAADKGWKYQLLTDSAPKNCISKSPTDESLWKDLFAQKIKNKSGSDYPASDYQVAARFEEGAKADRPILLGFRCGGAWCRVNARNASDIRAHAHAASSAIGRRREADISGWLDEQVVAVPDPANPGRMKRGLRSSIVPIVGLADLHNPDFAKAPNGIQVATVFFADDPVGTKYAAAGMQKGENEVWLRAIQATNGTWSYEGYVRTATGFGPKLKTTQHPMTALMPGSARWRWQPNDEGMWVVCDQGCCEMSF